MRTLTHRVLVGGTASGKKTVAAALARRHGVRPLSMDSMKVYRGMDIGTDKPPRALVDELDWGLLDLAGHDEVYSAGRWAEDARSAVDDGDGPVLFAGGTPLYLRLLLRGLFPGPPGDDVVRAELEALWAAAGEDAFRRELAAVDPVLEARILPGDKRRLVRGLEVHRLTGRPLSEWQAEETRPPIDGRFVVAALRHATAHHERRLRERVGRMFDDGLLDEVSMLASRAPFAKEAGRAIGYAEALAVLAGELPEADARERVAVRTRQLVRKQRIFLASFPEIRWVDVAPDEDADGVVARVEEALELG